MYKKNANALLSSIKMDMEGASGEMPIFMFYQKTKSTQKLINFTHLRAILMKALFAAMRRTVLQQKFLENENLH